MANWLAPFRWQTSLLHMLKHIGIWWFHERFDWSCLGTCVILIVLGDRVPGLWYSDGAAFVLVEGQSPFPLPGCQFASLLVVVDLAPRLKNFFHAQLNGVRNINCSLKQKFKKKIKEKLKSLRCCIYHANTL